MSYLHASFGFTNNRSVEAREEYASRLQAALRPLLYDREISGALEQRRPHALYRLLKEKRKMARVGDWELYDRLIRSRELFVTPVRNTPSLFRAQGIGTKLFLVHGVSPPDGSRLATLFLAIGPIPLCPLAQYLVRTNQQGPWEILGKVPLSKAHEQWKVVGFVAAILLAVGVAAYCASAVTK